MSKTVQLKLSKITYNGDAIGYKSTTKYARTWFRIGHSGDRYLHTGLFSAGCITLTEQNKWDKLYKILIRARKNDGKSIGTIKIID